MRKRRIWSLAILCSFCSFALLSTTAPADAQASATPRSKGTFPPAHQPGPGDPLPPFSVKAPHNEITIAPDGQTVTITGGAEFSMGDLKLTSDQLTVTGGYRHIEATGHVVLTRGDEVLHGSSFVLDAETATFTTDDATLVSPPISLRAAHITHDSDGTRAENAHIATGTTDGNGEFQLRAEHALIATGESSLKMQNVAVMLYGVRLLTLRRLTINLERSRPKTAEGNNQFTLPVIVRESHLSGLAVGLNLPYAPYPNFFGRATVVDTTREGIEYLATLGHTLYSRSGPTARHPFHFGEKETNPDHLRALLTARPAPQPLDPVLDFSDITVTTDPLVAPTRSAGTDLHTTLTLSHHQEFPNQRQGPLLVSRFPELVLSGRLPLSTVEIPEENDAARHALRTLRFALTGEAGTGEYEENRLFGDHSAVRANRVDLIGGIGTSPLLIGDHLLAEVQSTQHVYHYQNSEDYRFLETRVDADYIFGTRTALGAAYITRARGGTTPFYFDEVDTQDEGQLRGELGFGPRRRYTVAVVGRYDLDQDKFYDYEIAGAIRGHNVEPRLSYRHLNRQFNFALSFPGITSP